MSLGFVSKLFGSDHPRMVQMLTPEAAGERGSGARLALAGITAVGLAVSGVVALGALLALLAALGMIYYLLSEVLGIELELDPRAFVEQARAYAQQARAQ